MPVSLPYTYNLISFYLHPSLWMPSCWHFALLHYYEFLYMLYVSFIMYERVTFILTLPKITFTYGNVIYSKSQYIIVSSLLKVPNLTLFDYKYPDWSITVGYIIGFSSFMWIPIYMVYKLVWTPGSLKQVSGCYVYTHFSFQIKLFFPEPHLFRRGWRCVWDQRGPYQTSTLTTSTWPLFHREKRTFTHEKHTRSPACSFLFKPHF